MVLTASPAWSEKPSPRADAKPELGKQLPETRMIVGSPAIPGRSRGWPA